MLVTRNYNKLKMKKIITIWSASLKNVNWILWKFSEICLYFTQIIKKYHKSYHFQVLAVNMKAAMLKPEQGSHQPLFHSNMAASTRKAKTDWNHSFLSILNCIMSLKNIFGFVSLYYVRIRILILELWTTSWTSWHPRAQLYASWV